MTDPTDPMDPTDPPDPTDLVVPADSGESTGTAPSGRAPTRRRATPVVRWIRGLSQAAYAGLLVLLVAVLLLLAVLVNPGERVGPVRPAAPPVGGPGLPAGRL